MASQIDTAQFKNGLKIELDGNPFTITYFQHVKPGKGGAFVIRYYHNVARTLCLCVSETLHTTRCTPDHARMYCGNVI